jgi:Na+(H+)/acetate symporter ActP
VLILPAIYIASQGYSVLYLFLIADLVCAAALFPVFYGLYSKRLAGAAAMLSALAGLVVGALFFPNPDFGAWNELPGAGRLVISFGAALGVSGVLSIAFGIVARVLLPEATFDFSRLREKVGLIEG